MERSRSICFNSSNAPILTLHPCAWWQRCAFYYLAERQAGRSSFRGSSFFHVVHPLGWDSIKEGSIGLCCEGRCAGMACYHVAIRGDAKLLTGLRAFQ